MKKIKSKLEVFTCELPQKNPKGSRVKKLPEGKNFTEIHERKTCPIADERTNGNYYCSRDVGHDGPCAAHPVSPDYTRAYKFWRFIFNFKCFTFHKKYLIPILNSKGRVEYTCELCSTLLK